MAMNLYLHCLMGIQCNEFTMIAADKRNTQSIIVVEDDEDKIYEVSDKIVIGLVGECGDRAQLVQLVSKNLDLYRMKNKYALGTSAVTHFTRKILTDALNNKCPFIVNALVAGFDADGGCQLHTLDVVASCMRVPFASHGLAGQLCIGILADYYKPDLTEAQAYEVLKICVSEIHKRLFTHLPAFSVKTISKDGIRVMPIIGSPPAI